MAAYTFATMLHRDILRISLPTDESYTYLRHTFCVENRSRAKGKKYLCGMRFVNLASKRQPSKIEIGGNHVSADRGFASTTQQHQQQGVNALYQCLLIKSSLSRYCTNHGREPVEQYSESLSFNNQYHRNIS